MKEDKENKIDDYFREGLDNLNIIPPVEVWNNISEYLPEKKGNRKVFLWIAVAASVSLFAAFSGWEYLHNSKNNRTDSILVATQHQSSKKTIEKKEQDIISQDNPKKINNQHSNTTQTIAIIPDTKSANETNDQYFEPQASKGKQSGLVESNLTVSEINAKENVNPLIGESQILTKSEKTYPLTAIQLNKFDTPELYGKVNMGSSVVIKVDTTPVYDNIYAFEDVAETKEKINRWAIGGDMAPLYSYRNISDVNAPGLTKSSMDNIEKAVITYASGVKVDYEASSRLTFQTGVYYMKMGQELENISSFTKPTAKSGDYIAFASALNSSAEVASPVTNSTGIIVASEVNLYSKPSLNSDKQEYSPGNLPLRPADTQSKKNIEQTFEFIEVPFLAKYKIIDRKVNFHLLGGLSTHVLVNNKTKLTGADNSVTNGKTTDVETFNYSSSVGFGIGFNLRKNLLINFEPTFKYYLNSFNSNSSVSLHPYAFGLYSGFSFKF